MISGAILARNEADQIVPCIEALRPHVDEILLIDMVSEDATVKLAEPLVDQVVSHPLIDPFDSARNIACDHVQFDWIWFVDADERIPDEAARLVRHLITTQGDSFDAITIPFKSYFCDKWIEHSGWWPGYTAPRVLRKGRFRFGERLHSGVQVDGQEIRLHADPALGVDHFSYRDISHYLEKLNRYSSTEAKQLHEDGQSWSWEHATRHMVHDLWMYYEANQGIQDGEHGWILAWLSGQYRWLTHAKLWDQSSSTNPEPSVPPSLDHWVDCVLDQLHQLRAKRPVAPMGVQFRSPLWDSSGYAEDSRCLIKSFARGSRRLNVEELRWNDQFCELPPDDRALFEALTNSRRAPHAISITDCIVTLVEPDPRCAINVLRTTFETDRIPMEWLERIRAFHEVWVPSAYNARAFRRSGIPPERIRQMPIFFDPQKFNPDGPCLPRCDAMTDRFVFLSVLEWQRRKGWDVLLRAYVRAFPEVDQTDGGPGLLLKVSTAHGQTLDWILSQADKLLNEVGTSLAARTDITFEHQRLSAAEMAALYRSADCFVLPTRGEGWGCPFMEAMACGIPVIGTNASGNVDFMNADNSFLIRADEVDVDVAAFEELPIYRGHRWHEPEEDHLTELLRTVYDDSELRDQVAQRGMAYVHENLSLNRGQECVEQAIGELEAPYLPRSQPPEILDSQLRVCLEGELYAGHSFSNINEILADHLAKQPGIALSVNRRFMQPTHDQQVTNSHQTVQLCNRFSPETADIVIRHAFPPNWEPVSSGRWIHIQPFEFGYLPVDWIEPLNDAVDEIWVPTKYVQRVYVKSGVRADKIHVIPWGIDPETFDPAAPPLHLATQKTFRFLFVGGAIERKGFDQLLDAYLGHFTRTDDVCLVVKDMGVSTYYRDSAPRARLMEAMNDPDGPEILYFNQEMTSGQLASLYSACDCLVIPYRGEGFGLPILEAMACGCVPMVPSGGASDDFVDETCGWRIPSQLVSTVHDWPLVGTPQQLSVDPSELGAMMRHAARDPGQVESRALAASRRARLQFTWEHSVNTMLDRMRALAGEQCLSRPQHKAQPFIEKSSIDVAAVVACGRDDHLLPACLALLAPHVKELFVIDLEATERVSRLAREYGAEVVSGPIESAKNTVSKRSQCEWLACLNQPLDFADEELASLLAQANTDSASRLRFDASHQGVQQVRLVRRQEMIALDAE